MFVAGVKMLVADERMFVAGTKKLMADGIMFMAGERKFVAGTKKLNIMRETATRKNFLLLFLTLYFLALPQKVTKSSSPGTLGYPSNPRFLNQKNSPTAQTVFGFTETSN